MKKRVNVLIADVAIGLIRKNEGQAGENIAIKWRNIKTGDMRLCSSPLHDFLNEYI